MAEKLLYALDISQSEGTTIAITPWENPNRYTSRLFWWCGRTNLENCSLFLGRTVISIQTWWALIWRKLSVEQLICSVLMSSIQTTWGSSCNLEGRSKWKSLWAVCCVLIATPFFPDWPIPIFIRSMHQICGTRTSPSGESQALHLWLASHVFHLVYSLTSNCWPSYSQLLDRCLLWRKAIRELKGILARTFFKNPNLTLAIFNTLAISCNLTLAVLTKGKEE